MAGAGYDFYLGKCRLPVAPGKLQTKINGANKTLSLINEGEVNILKNAGLTDIDLECMVPQQKYPFAVYQSGFRGADYFLGYVESLKTGKKPFQFIVCRMAPGGKRLFDTNIRVSLEDYQITEEIENGLDLVLKIKLKQWRDYGTKTVSVSTSLEASRPRASVEPQRENISCPAPSTEQKYTVVKGDCLWNIAKKFYGNGSKYSVIYNANRSVVGGNPNLIYPGQVLTIPAV